MAKAEGLLSRVVRVLFGARPRVVLLFLAPTLFAIVLDFGLRGRSLLVFPPKEWLNYFGSSLARVGFWAGPLWLCARLMQRRAPMARAALALLTLVFILPLATFGFVGQALYYRVFHAYMARDTVRLGIALRGTLGAWLTSWGASFAFMAVMGIALTAAILLVVRRASPPLATSWPIVPVVGFGIAVFCFWVDFVESRSLQAAPPDTCFIHGVMHAIHDGVSGKGWVRRGISLREPATLPAIAPAEHRPNVILVITESVRADALCSAHSGNCQSKFLDEVASERMSLGRLTTQSSGTFSACVMAWTGLAPDADFSTMHHAPVLWEEAHAVGYRTAYIGSQNLRYDDFSAFLKNASIDVIASAVDLGDASDPHIGAPDENATARMLSFAESVPAGAPYFAVLHLSNTHWPYRVAPDLEPFAPHDSSPLADVDYLHNHYRNSVLMQERTVASFLRDLRALPSWDDTVVVFLSDHGEEFREHGGLYHLTTLFDEQVRVPGFLLAGKQALDDGQRAALTAYADRRTFSQDVHVTVLDLLGLYEKHSTFPFADRVTGRSLLRAPAPPDPLVLLSTASGVWEPDDPKYGVMVGDKLAVRSATSPWWCFDVKSDPAERSPIAPQGCAPLIRFGEERFKGAWK